MAKTPKKSKESQEELSVDERELFLTAFYQGEILPQEKFKREIEPAPKRAVVHYEAIEDDERDLFLQAVNEGFKEDYRHHKPTAALRKPLPSIKKKNMVDAEIDLHGYSMEDAIFALNRFLEKEQRRGSRTLLVVHGKGTGVLRNAVWSIVDTHPLVDDFQIASGKLGGQGAIVVRINRSMKRK